MSNHNIRVDPIGLAAEVVELRNEIARLKNQTNWVCKCGGTDCEGQRENAALRDGYVEMGKTALKSEINHYIGSIIMTDEQRKLREAVKKELPERASWAEIYAIYEMVRDRAKEAQP